MKSKIFSLITVLVLVTAFSLPVFAATSNYSFTMDYRLVNGKDNGIYHSLSKGTARINGYAYVYSKDHPNAPGPYDINYSLYKDAWGFDPYYGTVNGGINRSFSGTFSELLDETSNKYYLIIWKTEDDGQNVKGYGQLYN